MKWFVVFMFSVFAVIFVIFGVQFGYSYMFPIKYQEEIAAASAEYGVEEAVIYSCINVESHFSADVISCKGAVGLMQVMPLTAAEFAENFDLTNAHDNINIGTKYLSKMIARFEDLSTAMAAYNAGPSTVQSWLEDERYSDDGHTLKLIPYEETKTYVKKFNQNLKYYRSQLCLTSIF